MRRIMTHSRCEGGELELLEVGSWILVDGGRCGRQVKAGRGRW